jgi:nitrogen fixation/metabolism regulation signal transduction histidine kinase
LKQIRRRIPSTLYSFPLLFFILILVFIASWLLAVFGIGGMFTASLFNTPKGILLLVVGPLALIVFIGLLLFGIVSESFRHGVPNRTGKRLFLAFCFIIICSSFPQSVITGRFVSTALNSWFSSSVSRSLESARDIADLYSAERIRLIESVADTYLTGLSIATYRARHVDWMPAIRLMDPHAAACQVYMQMGIDSAGNPAYSPVIETGDSSQFVPRDRLDQVKDGIFSLDADGDVFRFGRLVNQRNASYICVYTSGIPTGYRARLDAIYGAWDQAHIIDTLDPFLPFMGIWIYLMFTLPSILMMIVIAFYLSFRFTDPVRTIQESVNRLAAGDTSFRIIPHAKDELADIARDVNTIAGKAGRPSRPSQSGASAQSGEATPPDGDERTGGTRKKPDKKAFLRL